MGEQALQLPKLAKHDGSSVLFVVCLDQIHSASIRAGLFASMHAPAAVCVYRHLA